MKISVRGLQKCVSNSVPKIKFSDGNVIPIFGLGTYLMKKKGETEDAVKFAIDVGYRHFDGASFYRNEDEVGRGIKAKICEGVIKREDIFITGKLWSHVHRPDLVEPALRSSLRDLQLNYVDLYLVHWPFALKEGDKHMPINECGRLQFSCVDYVDTWNAMEQVKELGLTKSIGLSNFNKKQIERLLKNACICPVNLQIECHPYFNQKRLIDFARSVGLTVTAWSPLAAPGRSKELNLLKDPTILKMASKYNKTVAQIALRYQVERGIIVIPKSVTKQRIIENFEIFNFSLNNEDMECINSMDKRNKGRTIYFEIAFGHPDHPFEKDEY